MISYMGPVVGGLTDHELNLLNTPLSNLSEKDKLDALAALDKKTKLIEELNKSYVPQVKIGGFYVISDNIDGVLNHANGKRYDSKSQYYADLKASGHIIVESGMEQKRETRGNFDVAKELKRAARDAGLL